MDIHTIGNNVVEKTQENRDSAITNLKAEAKKPHRLQNSGYIFSQIRCALGMTQKEMADFLRVDTRTIVRWESGANYLLTFEQLNTLAYELAKLGVDVINLSINFKASTEDLKILNAFKMATV